MAITHDMTMGGPTRGILRFSMPLIAGYLLQQLYNVADAAIVGRFIGVEALSDGAPYSFPEIAAFGVLDMRPAARDSKPDIGEFGIREDAGRKIVQNDRHDVLLPVDA